MNIESDAIRSQLRPSQSKLGMWFDHHVYSLVASLGRLFRKPWATALTVGVMAVALALPLGLWATLQNVQRFAGNMQQSQQISVFLKPAVAVDRAKSLAKELKSRADVAAVELRTPEQGLEELRQRGLGDSVAALEGNPLPNLLIVTPKLDGNALDGSTRDSTALAQSLQALPEADVVQHDAGWRNRLDQWLGFGARLSWVLAALLGLGALLVVGNTVRLDIQARRDEIGVLQLLGASDGFIRRPFLYLGACYGVLAGALALALLTATDLALREPLAEVARSYGSGFALRGFDIVQAVAIVVGAGVLGWLGAGLVTGHYLRQTRPTET
jgi:cell division transport system permease protein